MCRESTRGHERSPFRREYQGTGASHVKGEYQEIRAKRQALTMPQGNGNEEPEDPAWLALTEGMSWVRVADRWVLKDDSLQTRQMPLPLAIDLNKRPQPP